MIEETAKEGARRLAGFMLAKDYQTEALHEYTDENGFPLYFRIRLKHPVTGEKWIRPVKHDGTSYVFGEPQFPAGKPLYRLHQLRLRPDEVVYVVEGEKCVEALEKLGLLATTSGAADSFEAADWSSLAERDVVIWADNDEAGQRYADGATRQLEVLGCKVQHVAITELGLPEKGDCVDWLAANPGITADDVLALPMIVPPKPRECDGTGLLDYDPQSVSVSAANDVATIARLAALPPLQYDRVRKDEAKILGVRPDTLDKLVREARQTEDDEAPFIVAEPWPEPVDPAQLLDEILATIRRFIVLDIKQAHATTLWVAFT